MRTNKSSYIERKLKRMLREDSFDDREMHEYLELVCLLEDQGYRIKASGYRIKFEERQYLRHIGICGGDLE